MRKTKAQLVEEFKQQRIALEACRKEKNELEAISQKNAKDFKAEIARTDAFIAKLEFVRDELKEEITHIENCLKEIDKEINKPWYSRDISKIKRILKKNT